MMWPKRLSQPVGACRIRFGGICLPIPLIICSPKSALTFGSPPVKPRVASPPQPFSPHLPLPQLLFVQFFIDTYKQSASKKRSTKTGARAKKAD